jgi:hypothetical protein
VAGVKERGLCSTLWEKIVCTVDASGKADFRSETTVLVAGGAGLLRSVVNSGSAMTVRDKVLMMKFHMYGTMQVYTTRV